MSEKLDFDFFYKWVKKNLNLDLSSYKELQLQRRISSKVGEQYVIYVP